MGLFTRQKQATKVTGSNNHASGVHEKRTPNKLTNRRHRTRSNGHSMYSSDSLNTRPSFGQWLKVTWPDLLTMVIVGIIGLGIYKAPPAPSRSFPVFFADGEIVYPEFAYPLRNEIVLIWLAALFASLIPIAIFLLMQSRTRSFWDVNNATIGLLYSLITAAVFKSLSSGSLAVCAPTSSTSANPSFPDLTAVLSRLTGMWPMAPIESCTIARSAPVTRKPLTTLWSPCLQATAPPLSLSSSSSISTSTPS